MIFAEIQEVSDLVSKKPNGSNMNNTKDYTSIVLDTT